MDIKNIEAVLSATYNIKVSSVCKIRGGWSAMAYLATETTGREYLVKIYDNSRKSTARLTSHIDSYMPVVSWLSGRPNLRNKLVHPIQTIDGKYRYNNDRYVFLLQHYVQGEDLVDKELTRHQVIQLADIVAELHSLGNDIPIDTRFPKETFEVEFGRELRDSINSASKLKKELYNVLSPHIDRINNKLEELSVISQALKNRHFRYVPCHRDIHEGNILQSDNGIVLIDWENIQLAPFEADIFSVADKPWFGIFMDQYRNRHPHSRIDNTCIQYYSLYRKLNDIWEFTEQLQFDKITSDEFSQNLIYLEKECEAIS